MQERFDVYDAQKRKTGKTCYRGEALPAGEYHIAAVAIIVNAKNQLLMTRRSPEKKLPGLWECTAGSVLAGESSYEGVVREIKEEIGIDIDQAQRNLIHSFVEDDAIFDVWYFCQDVDLGDVALQASEVVDVKYADRNDIKSLIREKRIVPNLAFIDEFIERGILKIKA